ncbi:tRNA (guanosine(18)-2'-O)-methyltransferase TARBP1 isoform X2 [Augochlora pura]
MQILLILHPILNKVDTTNLGNFLLNLLLLESNQHSVRLMQEWLLIKICVQNENFRYELWSFFEETILKRPGCVGSIACIFYHVAKLLPEVDRTKFIYMGLPYLSRYCLGPQYNMRLYNQVVFVNLFDMVEPYGDFTKDCINEYRGLFKTILKNFKDERTHDNFFRIQNDFYLSTFHALHDYSLQTIYCELPRLTDMDQSEWISPLIFEQLNFKESHNHPLQIYNPTDLLSKIETSIYIAKSTTDSEFLKKSETNLEELNNIQKKIDPLISANLSQNFISSSIRESISQKKLLLHGEGIIVVACLIDRKQNLGGLARTCEIFNVKELVIANLSQIRDKDFQNLSVSAENWINIREVKPHELSKYLLGKRYEGWSLIGVEQTVNSVSLLNMKFKKKTVLVLGNEKDGVPANLIPLFDTCIEIPQLGIIRSLNVHVCGAICIWQYAMQHTF